MDGDEDAIDYSDDDPEDEDGYEADPALSYDEEKSRRWEEWSGSLWCWNQQKSLQMI